MLGKHLNVLLFFTPGAQHYGHSRAVVLFVNELQWYKIPRPLQNGLPKI